MSIYMSHVYLYICVICLKYIYASVWVSWYNKQLELSRELQLQVIPANA